MNFTQRALPGPWGDIKGGVPVWGEGAVHSVSRKMQRPLEQFCLHRGGPACLQVPLEEDGFCRETRIRGWLGDRERSPRRHLERKWSLKTGEDPCFVTGKTMAPGDCRGVL